MDADIAIVGLGTMGSMAAWRLSKETDLAVIGFEQYGLGHAHGSASGESRLFRAAYHENASYVPFLVEARKLWLELAADSDREVFLPTGTLSIGKHDAPQLKNVFASVEQYDIPHEILDEKTLAARYPQHRLFGGEVGIFDQLGGGLRPELAVTSALELASKNGAELHPYTPVTDIQFEDSGVTIVTSDRSYRVRKVIVASGAWTAKLVPELSDSLVIKPLLLTWFTPHKLAEFTPDVFPTFIRDTDDFHIFGAPVIDGFSLKISVNDIYPPIASPEALNRYFPEEEVSRIGERVTELIPGVFPEPVRHTVHLDGYLPERVPVVGNFDPSGRGILLTGFSGHGFKFAPIIGEIAKCLATDEDSSFDLSPFSPQRFLADS